MNCLEPQIVDYYNEQPGMVKVIDNMNEELSVVQTELAEYKEERERLIKEKNEWFIRCQVYEHISRKITEILNGNGEQGVVDGDQMKYPQNYLAWEQSHNDGLYISNIIEIFEEFCEDRGVVGEDLKLHLHSFLEIFFHMVKRVGGVDIIYEQHLHDCGYEVVTEDYIRESYVDFYNDHLQYDEYDSEDEDSVPQASKEDPWSDIEEFLCETCEWRGIWELPGGNYLVNDNQ